MLFDALTYPIRRSGWMMILCGAIFSIILHVGEFAPFIGGIAGISSAGYFGAFYLDIVGTTMVGRDEVPEWPSPSDYWDDIVSPLLQLSGLIILSFGPSVVIALAAPEQAVWHGPAVIAAGALGCLYFPMAVLATQAMGGFDAAFPHIVLPAVWKALPGYLLALTALILVFALCAFAEVLSTRILAIGWFLTPTFALYGLMFQGRLIGLIYRDKRGQLGWE